MVRVAALKEALAEGDTAPDVAGMTPAQQLQRISERAHAMVDQLYATLTGEILPPLAERGLKLVRPGDLEPPARATLARYFRDEVLPALTPLAIDASRPFPMLAGLSLNLAVLLGPPEGEDDPRLAVVQVPGRLPRLVRPPGVEGLVHVLLEDVIWSELASLFPGQEIRDVAAFRIARDSELDFDDEGGRDYLQVIEEELKNRRRSGIVRLEIEDGVSEPLLALLVSRLGVTLRRRLPHPGAGGHPPPPAPRRPARARGPPGRSPQAAAGDRGGGPGALRPPRRARRGPPPPLRVLRPGGRSHVGRPPTTPTCSPSSRPSTGRAATRPVVRVAGAGGGERQAGHGPRGAARPLRRAVEHPLGAAPGGVGLPRHLRHPRLQDPLEDRPRGAARPAGHPALRPPRHRQLQREDRPALHRLRPHDLRPGDRGGRLRLLQRAHRLLRPAAHEEAGHGPDPPPRPRAAPRQPRAPARGGRRRPPRSAPR